MDDQSAPTDPLTAIGIVLSAEAAFAVLVDRVLGDPPAIALTIGFGLLVAAVLALQDRAAGRRIPSR